MNRFCTPVRNNSNFRQNIRVYDDTVRQMRHVVSVHSVVCLHFHVLLLSPVGVLDGSITLYGFVIVVLVLGFIRYYLLVRVRTVLRRVHIEVFLLFFVFWGGGGHFGPPAG